MLWVMMMIFFCLVLVSMCWMVVCISGVYLLMLLNIGFMFSV